MGRARAYVDADGNKPFEKWFGGLDWKAYAKVARAIDRLERGNTSNVASVGGDNRLLGDGPGASAPGGGLSRRHAGRNHRCDCF